MRLASFFSPYASKRGRIASAVAVLAFALTVAVSSVCVGTSTSIISEPSGRPWLAEWWNGKYATGNWFGLRDTLEDHGLTLGGKWTGLYYGVVDGVKPNIRGSFFDEEIKIHRETQLRRWEPLEGLKAFGGVRWRDRSNPNLRVAASANFQPSHFQ